MYICICTWYDKKYNGVLLISDFKAELLYLTVPSCLGLVMLVFVLCCSFTM